MKTKLLNRYITDAVKVVVGNLDEDIKSRYGFTDVRFHEDGMEFFKDGVCFTSNSMRFDIKERILLRIVEDLIGQLPEWMFHPGKFQVEPATLKRYLGRSDDIEGALSQILVAVSFYTDNHWSCPLCSSDTCELTDAGELVKEMGVSVPRSSIWMCAEHALVLQVSDFGASYVYMADLDKQQELNTKYAVYLDTLSSCREELPVWFYEEQEHPTLSLETLDEISQIFGPEEEQDEDEEDDWNDDDYRSKTSYAHLIQETSRKLNELITEKYGDIQKFASDILINGEPGIFAPDSIDKFSSPASEENKESYVSPFTGKPV